MSQIDHLVRLVTEIGPAMGLAGVFQITEKEEWELVLSEGFALSLQYDDSDDRLTITGDVIDLAEAPPANLLVSMMQYNAATTATGGVRLALDLKLTVLLIYDIPVNGLSLETLKNTVLSLADKIVLWRQGIAAKLQEAAGTVPSGTEPTSDALIINA